MNFVWTPGHFFQNENFVIPPENIKILSDSECCLIWARVIRTRFKIGIQTIITKLSLTMYGLNLCPYNNLTYINQHLYDFPVDSLTKVNTQETYKSIKKRHKVGSIPKKNFLKSSIFHGYRNLKQKNIWLKPNH